MSRQIVWSIAHLSIMCVIISLLIAIVSLIKSKLNIDFHLCTKIEIPLNILYDD